MKPKPEETLIFSSKVILGLVMTDRMLRLLHYRYAHVKSWKQMMLDLEVYLTRKPEKTPKDFKKFVLNCAKRHSEDVRSGKRLPDGKINLKAFANLPVERPKRDPSMTQQSSVEEAKRLREKLQKLERGTPEYDATLAELKETEHPATTMSLGDILNKIAEHAPTIQGE